MTLVASPAVLGRHRRRGGGGAFYVPPLTPAFWFEHAFAGFGRSQQVGPLVAPTGSDATAGTSSSPDTKDPTFVAAAGTVPAYSTFVDDTYDFPLILGPALWNNANGFSAYLCLQPTANDLLANAWGFTNHVSWAMRISGAKFQVINYADVGGTIYALFTTTASLVVGTRYVLGLTYNPALARTSRSVLYVNNNTPAAITTSTVGLDAPLPVAAAFFRQGFDFGTEKPASTMAGCAGYAGVHSAAQVATVITSLQTVYGWQ